MSEQVSSFLSSPFALPHASPSVHWLNGKFDMQFEHNDAPAFSEHFLVRSPPTFHLHIKMALNDFPFRFGWKLKSAISSQVREERILMEIYSNWIHAIAFELSLRLLFLSFLLIYWIVGKCQTPTSLNLLVRDCEITDSGWGLGPFAYYVTCWADFILLILKLFWTGNDLKWLSLKIIFQVDHLGRDVIQRKLSFEPQYEFLISWNVNHSTKQNENIWWTLNMFEPFARTFFMAEVKDWIVKKFTTSASLCKWKQRN